ncbi:MAG: alpha/beta fold hydrolase [Armatimonadetes bacterium]|nr:alpha/beta fold hydrolase [Armatimonadota bacterium]
MTSSDTQDLLYPQRFLLEKRTISPGIPLWLLHPGSGDDRPLVILQHGYTGSKESVLAFGLQIAGRGYRVLLPDARLHGERRALDFEARFEAEFQRTFLEVIEGTAEDVRTLIDTFGNGPVAMIGISMGAFITYLVLTHDPRIEVAVPLIGSPLLWAPIELAPEEEAHLREINPAAHPERFPPCAVLIQHGELDELVPIQPEYDLFERLQPHYREMPERLQFLPYAGIAHEVTQEMVATTLAWLEKFLPPQ